MSQQNVYLRQDVKAEPLYSRWYAWTHLIAPATAAMNVANSHLKIMKSYVAAPQMHASAVKNPKLLGGPFIDYEGGRVEEIRSLVTKVEREQSHMLAFADSVRGLDAMLRSEAKGFSLEPLYLKTPESLRGLVELVYDLNNQPAIRFIEGLLYKSRYYDPTLQSVSLSAVSKDYRPFALSTPRLPSEGVLQLDVPFASEALDELFSARQTPRPLGELKERLGVGPQQAEAFSSFFTPEPPPAAPRYDGPGVRVRYFGHACILVETKEVSVLVDPAISYAYAGGSRRYTYLDLPEVVDYVLITHGHTDHIMLESLLQLRHKARRVIVPRNRGGCLEDPSLKLVLKHVGFGDVTELTELETVGVPGGEITGVPFLGEHGDLNVGSKIAHLLRLKGHTFLLAADSNNIEPKLYDRVFEAVGEVEVLFLGMECDGAPLSWVYGPLMTQPLDRRMDQSRRLSGSDYERGIGLVDRFNCKEVYVYAMGQEPWLNYVMCTRYTPESNPIVASDRIVAECAGRGLGAERLYGHKELFYE
ncbi:MAG: MBL fold metallo-hydrolase [Acidobacteria bacterium]|nr:MBL fold metallo-hydrolase [Acidobacteriota bacterium]